MGRRIKYGVMHLKRVEELMAQGFRKSDAIALVFTEPSSFYNTLKRTGYTERIIFEPEEKPPA